MQTNLEAISSGEEVRRFGHQREQCEKQYWYNERNARRVIVVEKMAGSKTEQQTKRAGQHDQ